LIGFVVFFLSGRKEKRQSACGGGSMAQSVRTRSQRPVPEVRSQKSEVRGRRSEVGGQRSEVRGRRSEVRGRRSEVRGRRSEVGTVNDGLAEMFQFLPTWRHVQDCRQNRQIRNPPEAFHGSPSPMQDGLRRSL
jgi:hypothetical protein